MTRKVPLAMGLLGYPVDWVTIAASLFSGALGVGATLLYQQRNRAIEDRRKRDARAKRILALRQLLDHELHMAWFDMCGVFRPPGPSIFPLMTPTWDGIRNELPDLFPFEKVRDLNSAYYTIQEVRHIVRSITWVHPESDLQQHRLLVNLTDGAMDRIEKAIEALGISPAPKHTPAEKETTSQKADTSQG